MMIKFRIINQVLKVQHFSMEIEKHWKKFRYCENDSMDFQIEFIKKSTMNRDIEYASIQGCEHLMFSGNSLMCADQDYKNIYISGSDLNQAFETFSAYVFYTHVVRKQTLWIHSATIERNGKGVLFLGPSGIGKTTQAELWKKYRGASIINGDVGFVQRTKEGYLAWGTPWHGSSPYCINTSVPLKALVVLKQAPVNKLRELYGFEKVAEVSGSIMYPNWMPDGRELCADTLNHLLSDLPVYRLDNRADLEAVELLEKELNYII
ncbi:hypothetical protein [Sellimonas catena]|nr:hypothetical protein [Sellimonas catena]